MHLSNKKLGLLFFFSTPPWSITTTYNVVVTKFSPAFNHAADLNLATCFSLVIEVISQLIKAKTVYRIPSYFPETNGSASRG